MPKLSMSGRGDVMYIANLLCKEIQDSALSCELVDALRHTSGEFTVAIMVFEKYYWRANNRASLTVAVSGKNDEVFVDSIGSGGGQGPIFKLSWGAEEDFACTVADILLPLGFRRIKTSE